SRSFMPLCVDPTCLPTLLSVSTLFFFTHPAPPEIYTLSLHDALPISGRRGDSPGRWRRFFMRWPWSMSSAISATLRDRALSRAEDRKSTRLNSSHGSISYAVFCLKKKKTKSHDGKLSKSTEDRTRSAR